jgi:hypothetical protein
MKGKDEVWLAHPALSFLFIFLPCPSPSPVQPTNRPGPAAHHNENIGGRWGLEEDLARRREDAKGRGKRAGWRDYALSGAATKTGLADDSEFEALRSPFNK